MYQAAIFARNSLEGGVTWYKNHHACVQRAREREWIQGKGEAWLISYFATMRVCSIVSFYQLLVICSITVHLTSGQCIPSSCAAPCSEECYPSKFYIDVFKSMIREPRPSSAFTTTRHMGKRSLCFLPTSIVMESSCREMWTHFARCSRQNSTSRSFATGEVDSSTGILGRIKKCMGTSSCSKWSIETAGRYVLDEILYFPRVMDWYFHTQLQ